MEFAARRHLCLRRSSRRGHCRKFGSEQCKEQRGREESQLIRRDDKAEKVPFCLSPLPPLLLPFHERVLGPAAAIIRRQKTALVDWEYSVDHPSRCRVHVHSERILTILHRHFYKGPCTKDVSTRRGGGVSQFLTIRGEVA